MVPDELKFEPRSKGLATPRKKKPKELAVITECCTGCAGSPACVEICPVEDCCSGYRTKIIRPLEDPGGSRSVHRLQEMRQQRAGWVFSAMAVLGTPSRWSTRLRWRRKLE